MKVIIKSILLSSLVSLFTLGSVVSAAQCTNDVWNKVMKRGKVVVGVKADYYKLPKHQRRTGRNGNRY